MSSRAALLAALCFAALMGRTVLAANAPSAWSNLWRTPDQQGQALLEAGQPARAAERFQDPRRRAYADLEAGQYDEAAKQLAPFNDVQSEYNRGNALARSGKLQAALSAYDAALKQAPADVDIRHNRDLVARALQQQRQSPQSTSQNGRQGQQSQAGAKKQGGSGSRQSGNGSQSPGGSQSAPNGSQADANRGNGAQQRATANGSNSTAEAPGQAQRDAAQAAAIARAQRGRGAPGDKAQGQDAQRNGMLAGGTQTPKQQPETERQLALDQWLRQIPDSAAGLLQRKFLIEHMMRQQDSGQ